jgi:hypothetical protein
MIVIFIIIILIVIHNVRHFSCQTVNLIILFFLIILDDFNIDIIELSSDWLFETFGLTVLELLVPEVLGTGEHATMLVFVPIF